MRPADGIISLLVFEQELSISPRKSVQHVCIHDLHTYTGLEEALLASKSRLNPNRHELKRRIRQVGPYYQKAFYPAFVTMLCLRNLSVGLKSLFMELGRSKSMVALRKSLVSPSLTNTTEVKIQESPNLDQAKEPSVFS